MNPGPRVSGRTSSEEFLSGAYRRILKITVWLSFAAVLATTIIWSWRSGLALAVGAAVACLNMIWLHRGVEMAVERMAAPEKTAPSRARLFFAFAGRYVFMIAAAYVIFKGYPQTRVAFMAGLACPVIAAMGEGIYEAAVIGKTDQTPD